MASKSLFNSVRSGQTDTIEVLYISPDGGAGTRIDSFTASNDTGVNRSYKAYIYPKSGSDPQAVVPFKVVLRDRFDNAPSLTNKIIPPGGSLRAESSLLETLSFTAAGKDL